MSRFKTELCNNLIELGNCKYGDRCHYAHGAHELRQVSRRHPKYRTEKCKNFELTGKCPFGPRCSYVHPKPDLDSMIDQLSKYMKHTKAPKPDLEDENMIFSDHRFSVSDDGINSPISPQTSTSSPPPALFQMNGGVGRKAAEAISSAALINSRTPLSSTSSNILTSTNFSNNHLNLNHQTAPLSLQKHQTQSTYSNDPMIDDIISNKLRNNSYSNNSSVFEHFNSEQGIKKPRLNSNNSTNSNESASSPFGINNPFSDYFNRNTNPISSSRDPLQPNKQFYTRF